MNACFVIECNLILDSEKFAAFSRYKRELQLLNESQLVFPIKMVSILYMPTSLHALNAGLQEMMAAKDVDIADKHFVAFFRSFFLTSTRSLVWIFW